MRGKCFGASRRSASRGHDHCAGCSRQGSRGACSHSLRRGAGGRAALAMASCLWAHTKGTVQSPPPQTPLPSPPGPSILYVGPGARDHHSHMSGKGPPARWTPARGRPPWPCPSPPPLREPAPPTTGARGQIFRVGSPSASVLARLIVPRIRGHEKTCQKEGRGRADTKGARRGTKGGGAQGRMGADGVNGRGVGDDGRDERRLFSRSARRSLRWGSPAPSSRRVGGASLAA
jgi:hypothetical protein